ncbi:uncharacterized protein LOC111268132 isoform X2 [Varroa jacobsoni]|uniref:GSKIP domain-containing protein n=1 Tax=Varroa destructor TaxID=109461 RepID=A0A7M7KS74_VARDE|nr:uncharacterized protein LOC111253909 isoform X2 [Varroa destructor]XP_022702630.1 uncharacterized protein LOC111268132 isoform X2 [Varroa jacobsoni]
MASPMATTPEPPYGIQEVPFPEEVESVMNDVRFGVEEISLSKKFAVTPISAHLNIITKEDRTLFVLMSPQGFRIIGDARDTSNIENGAVYETIQALLDHESPEYRRRFSEALAERLKAIADEEHS